MPAQRRKRRWVRDVKTVSTFPPQDLFTRDAETIARIMASRKVSPGGIGSGIHLSAKIPAAYEEVIWLAL